MSIRRAIATRQRPTSPPPHTNGTLRPSGSAVSDTVGKIDIVIEKADSEALLMDNTTRISACRDADLNYRVVQRNRRL